MHRFILIANEARFHGLFEERARLLIVSCPIRYFAPWRPVPVAPIGLDMFSTYGAIVVLVELALFSPVLFFALRPWAARARPVATGSFIAIWMRRPG